MVVVPKEGGQVRICVDLTHLNKSVERELFPMPSVDSTLARLNGAKVFSKLDAKSGFWQIPLSHASQLLTTFITPHGRYCFTRLPFGISSASEFFQKRFSKVLDGVEGAVNHVDDVLVWGRTQEEHDRRLRETLNRLKGANITLNHKCEISRSQVKFLGHIIGEDGIKPDPDKVSAILTMTAPTDVASLRRFLGMTNQMNKFTPNLAELTKPLRDLLSNKAQWLWGAAQETAFQKIKQELTKSPTLAWYDVHKMTKVSADASSYGIGCVILQKHGEHWKPAAYASRSLSDTEQRYAQIEKEALAVTWACEKFAELLVGKQFMIETDHKPLIPLLGCKALDTLPLRVQRYRLRLMRFDYLINHVPGKNLEIADALSRAPSGRPEEIDRQIETESDAYVHSVVNNMPASDKRMAEIRKDQKADATCSRLMKYCTDGWPESEKTGPYWAIASELSIYDDILMRGSRMVIPMSLRESILQKIHDGHQGIAKCRRTAARSVWWPKINDDIEEFVHKCPECAKHRNNPVEPMISTETPAGPWQQVAGDLFELQGTTYLLVIDYYSKYIEVLSLDQTSAAGVIRKMKAIFARHGIPLTVMTDNAQQFKAKCFQEFAQEYGFTHVTSSPTYPQSNGEAERAVRTMKDMWKKSSDPFLALLAYRSTPLECGSSPAELLMGRQLRSRVPTSNILRPHREPSEFRAANKKLKERQRRNYNRRHRARSLPPLTPGTKVWVDNEQGIVVGTANSPRSYVVRTDQGKLRRRNRRHLRERH